MRLPFFDPRRDEVAAIAADLITRFGLRAHEEALYLAELSLQMGSRRKRVLYELVAREIETSFLEAQRRLGLRQSASDLAHLGAPVLEGSDGGPQRAGDGAELPELGGPAPHIRSRTADVPTGLVADLNLVDLDPWTRRRPVEREFTFRPNNDRMATRSSGG
jgi:hypothetical protein